MSDAVETGGWPLAESPFQTGALAWQDRLGCRAELDQLGRRTIRPALIAQHRAFYPLLRFLLIGATDADGWPWADVVTGPPGFVRAIDPHLLQIAAVPTDGLAARLHPGARVGLLGLDPATRRRNRINGRIVTADGGGLTVSVQQSFGNCPQYIPRRDFLRARAPEAAAAMRRTRIDPDAARLISATDSFYIASTGSYNELSHRGGPPGFLRIERDDLLVLPDYPGNRHFKTLGNLTDDARGGLLLIDPDRGDLLQIAFRADIDSPAPDRRTLRLQVVETVRRAGAFPWVYGPPEPSPAIAALGP